MQNNFNMQSNKLAYLQNGVLIANLCLTLGLTDSKSVHAEKKYIFKPGSRQAIEVDTNSPNYRQAQPGRVVRQGMSSSMYRRRIKQQRNTTAGRGSLHTKSSGKGTTNRLKSKRSYHFTDTVKVNERKRKYFVFVPESYSPGRRSPVLLVFHGLRMSAQSMTAVTGFNGVASRNNFVVIYCEAVNGKWNDGMRNAKGVDDIKYVKNLLSKIQKRISIDTNRIYACGLSNGGYFCQMIASAMPQTVKGIAVVGSTVMQQALASPKDAKPVPCVFFLGSEDPLLNWGDGRKRSLGKYSSRLKAASIDPKFLEIARYGGWMNVSDMINYWVTRNKCSSKPMTKMLPDKDRTDGMRVKLESYGTRGNAVNIYTIIGGSHSWPGALLLPGVKAKSCQDISASELIWKFFTKYAR